MLTRYNELGLVKKQALKYTGEILEIELEEILKAMQDYQAKQKEKKQKQGVAIGE